MENTEYRLKFYINRELLKVKKEKIVVKALFFIYKNPIHL